MPYQDHQHKLLAPVTDFIDCLRSPPPLLPLSSAYMQLVTSAFLLSPQLTLPDRPSVQCDPFPLDSIRRGVVLCTGDFSTVASHCFCGVGTLGSTDTKSCRRNNSCGDNSALKRRIPLYIVIVLPRYQHMLTRCLSIAHHDRVYRAFSFQVNCILPFSKN